MFARILTCEVKLEKKEELVKVVKNEILPSSRSRPASWRFCPFSRKE
jgi:hypothetical protein